VLCTCSFAFLVLACNKHMVVHMPLGLGNKMWTKYSISSVCCFILLLRNSVKPLDDTGRRA
jgi:hypothetical protein